MNKLIAVFFGLVSCSPLFAQESQRFHVSILGSRYTSGNLSDEFVAMLCYCGCTPVSQRNQSAGSLEALVGYQIGPNSSIQVGVQLNTKSISQKLKNEEFGGFFQEEIRWRYRGATMQLRTERDWRKSKLFLEVGPWLDVLAKDDRAWILRNVGGSFLVRPGIQFDSGIQIGVQALAAFTNYSLGEFPPYDKYYPYSVGASLGWRW